MVPVANNYTPTLLFCGGMDPVRDECVSFFRFGGVETAGVQGLTRTGPSSAGTGQSGRSQRRTRPTRASRSTRWTPRPRGSTTTTCPRTACVPVATFSHSPSS